MRVFSFASAAAILVVSAACSEVPAKAEDDQTPAVQTSADVDMSGFNIQLPEEETGSDQGVNMGGFNFQIPGENSTASSGGFNLPVNDDSDIDLPTAASPELEDVSDLEDEPVIRID